LQRYKFLILSIVVAVIGYGIWAGINDGQKIADAIEAIGWRGVVFLCGLSLCNYFLRYVRWYALLRHLGDKPSFVDGMACYWAGFALTTTPGKAGEAIRCVYFNTRHNVNNAHSFAALFVDRLTDLVVALIMAMAALMHFPQYHLVGWAMLLLLLTVVIAVNKPQPFLMICARLEGISPKFLRHFFAGVPAFFEKTALLMSWRVLFFSIVLGLVSWCAEAYGFSWLATLLGAQADVIVLMGMFFLAMMAGVVTPGGLGGTEVVMAALLMAVGLDASAAFVVSLICRVATLWFSIFVGLLSMLWLEYKPAYTE